MSWHAYALLIGTPLLSLAAAGLYGYLLGRKRSGGPRSGARAGGRSLIQRARPDAPAGTSRAVHGLAPTCFNRPAEASSGSLK
jgi:hypothetical protein